MNTDEKSALALDGWSFFAELAVLGLFVDHLVFGGVDGGLDFFHVRLLGVESDHDVTAHVADLVDVYDAFGLAENGGEVVATGLAGEALDLHRGHVSGHLEAIFGYGCFDLCDRHYFGVIHDHNAVGLGACSALVDSSHGTELDLGGGTDSFFFQSGDRELNQGSSESGIAGGGTSGVAFAFLCNCFRGVLRLGESAEGNESNESDNVFHNQGYNATGEVLFHEFVPL